MTPAVAPPVRRRRRFVLTGLSVTAVMAAAFAVWLGYRHVGRARELRAAIAEVEAADPHWRIEEIEAGRAVVPDAENSAALVRRAAARRRPTDPDEVRRRQDLLLNEAPDLRLTDEQYQELIDSLERQEAGIGLAVALARYPRGRHLVTYPADGLSLSLPHRDDLLTVFWYDLDPLLFALCHEGDGAGALEVCHALLNLGRSIGDEPILDTQLQRLMHTRSAVRGLERVLRHCTLIDESLAAFQRELAAEADSGGWALSLRGKRALLFQTMEAIRTGVLPPSALRMRQYLNGGAPSAVEQVRNWLEDRLGADVRPAQAWLLRYFTRMLELARLPWPERRAAVESLAAQQANAPELARLVLFKDGYVAERFQASQALVRCGVAAAALERYRLRRGAWPPSLGALVPEFLPAVPADPFDGQPLRYRRLADGVVVYSVSEDRTDDGGRLGSDLQRPTGTDLGIRLWDAPHRPHPRPSPEKSP